MKEIIETKPQASTVNFKTGVYVSPKKNDFLIVGFKEVKTPDAIKDLLWSEVPQVDEHDDPVSIHNTFVLASFLRGQESKK